MRRLYLAASGLGLSVAVSFALANPPALEPANPATSTATELDPFGELPVEQAEETKAADPETILRQAYLKVMHEKAALMDKAALEAALGAAQQDIRELEGQKLLGEAKAILQRVVDEYPNTRAASEASVLVGPQQLFSPPVANGKPI